MLQTGDARGKHTHTHALPAACLQVGQGLGSVYCQKTVSKRKPCDDASSEQI